MPQARAALDPFHVVRLAGEALNQCRRRVQQELHGRPGQADDPLYKAHRTLHTGNDLFTPSQHKRLEALFANDDHTPVEVTWSVYQKMITAYRQPKRAKGKRLMQEPITAISHGVPAALREDITLGRTLKKRAGDILAYFNHPPHQQRPHRSTQRTPRTPTRLSTGLSQPHQLHHPNTPRNRRLQTPPTPLNGKSLDGSSHLRG